MIYVAVDLCEQDKELLIKGKHDMKVVFQDELGDKDQLASFRDASICFGNIPVAWLEQSTRLKWVQLESVGFGEYQDLKEPGFTMTNLKGFFSVPVAETALAGILALFRGMDDLSGYKTSKEWRRSEIRPGLRLLQGSRVLILGGGTIGQQIRKLLASFQAKIRIFDRYLEDADFQTDEELDRWLPEADILISCLPETEDTTGMLDEQRLSSLGPQTIFVNVGRGSTVDEDSLIRLLNEKKIGGAVLDVTMKEPLPADHPLWDCPNTILTQHTGGGWNGELSGKVKLFLDNLDRYIKGESLMNVVDIEKGF